MYDVKKWFYTEILLFENLFFIIFLEKRPLKNDSVENSYFIVFILGKRVIYTYPMVKQTDMPDDMRAEVVEMCVNACEKHTTNNENAAKMIKELLDKKFGTSWHVVSETF